MTEYNLCKDAFSVVKRCKTLFDNQVRIHTDAESFPKIMVVDIVCRDGPFACGKISFEIKAEEMPQSPPSVRCMHEVIHPNISLSTSDGNICLNILAEDWDSNFTLEDVIQGLIFLLHNPNPDSQLESAHDEYYWDAKAFRGIVLRSLKGDTVDNSYGDCTTFPRLLTHPDTFEPMTDEEYDQYEREFLKKEEVVTDTPQTSVEPVETTTDVQTPAETVTVTAVTESVVLAPATTVEALVIAVQAEPEPQPELQLQTEAQTVLEETQTQAVETQHSVPVEQAVETAPVSRKVVLRSLSEPATAVGVVASCVDYITSRSIVQTAVQALFGVMVRRQDTVV